MAGSRYVLFLIMLLWFCIISSGPGIQQAIAQEINEVDQGPETEQTTEKEFYKIDVGDALEINVWKEPELTRMVTVRLDGRISLPLIGDVMAAGFAPMELAGILEEKIGEIIEAPTVTVILTASNSRVYYMVGEIGSGEYALNTPLTMMQAIARAGGLGEWADKRNIMIIRRTSGKDEMLFFDYKDFIKGKYLSKNIKIEYGDTVVVF